MPGSSGSEIIIVNLRPLADIDDHHREVLDAAVRHGPSDKTTMGEPAGCPAAWPGMGKIYIGTFRTLYIQCLLVATGPCSCVEYGLCHGKYCWWVCHGIYLSLIHI